MTDRCARCILSTVVAAKAVLLRDPLKLQCPALLHETTLPRMSVIETIVLLKVVFTKAIPTGTFFEPFLRLTGSITSSAKRSAAVGNLLTFCSGAFSSAVSVFDSALQASLFLPPLLVLLYSHHHS